MLKTTATVVGGGILALLIFFLLAGRPVSDLIGYFRAGASKTVQSLESEIPDFIHDEKAATELEAVRKRLVSRQVELNLARNQMQCLKHDIDALQKVVSSRAQILESAYPLLRDAVENARPNLTFGYTSFSINEFQNEIDHLLLMQETDENTLGMKRDGYDRLQQSVVEGTSALEALNKEIREVEQKFAFLKMRRDQARMEEENLDLIAGTTLSTKSSTKDFAQTIERLEGQVQRLEAKNAARREMSPVTERSQVSRLAQAVERLTALKKLLPRSMRPSGK